MVDGVLVALAVLNIYIVALFLLHHRGKLRGPTLEMVGPLLLWRTQRGRDAIDRISRPQRFWKAFGDAGVALALVSGAAMLLLLLLQIYILITRPSVVLAAAPSPEFLLVLPGINPLIPLWYGILALAVALIVHEGAHGILARAHQIKVKSLGLLMLVVPIGAFVEPDEEELERAPTRTKNRVFAAGIMSNLVVALVCAAAFSAAWGGVQPAHDGLAVTSVVDGQAASLAGIQPGMIVTSIESRPVATAEQFSAAMNQTRAGDTITVGLWQGGRDFSREAQLTDKYAYYARVAPELNNETFRGQGFLGVSTVPMGFMQYLRDVSAAPLSQGLTSFGFFLLLPFPTLGPGGLSPLPPAFEALYTVGGPAALLPAPVFWVLANSLYWIFWLNLMVGTFNALPLGFLDGGQMFKASLKGVLRRRAGIPREKLVVERLLGGRQVITRATDSATQAKVERVDAVVRTVTLTTGLAIAAMILVPILGPHLVRLI